MYEVVSTRHSGGPRDFFREREEAEAFIAGHVLHTREGNEMLEIPGPDYLTIVEVNRASKPCKFCGTEVQVDPVKYPQTDWCRSCHYRGRPQEADRAEQLEYFRTALGAEDVGPEHTGGGCFWMAFFFEGDDWYYIATDGDAVLPEDADRNPVRDGWGFIGRVPRTVEYDEETVVWRPEVDEDWTPIEPLKTDAELVEIIKADRAKREEQS